MIFEIILSLEQKKIIKLFCIDCRHSNQAAIMVSMFYRRNFSANMAKRLFPSCKSNNPSPHYPKKKTWHSLPSDHVTLDLGPSKYVPLGPVPSVPVFRFGSDRSDPDLADASDYQDPSRSERCIT
ncbi:hypothetical protein AVEN_235854-1 [Araneus ventricosus]|uniref:Uncharacterized protein n=1 Tax=Araneus ventricosus TaxID=182803 RepID=A0A4Y2VWA1_ARAVE|nr:hypothetical protein AVEN_235854-1 [Araneus ventricosus]